MKGRKVRREVSKAGDVRRREWRPKGEIKLGHSLFAFSREEQNTSKPRRSFLSTCRGEFYKEKAALREQEEEQQQQSREAGSSSSISEAPGEQPDGAASAGASGSGERRTPVL
ncbi:hypothetical protein E2C01_068286 [Portunus trituberculatus]|uniref:Uncharacterized protein n=1 Tax=Portunus trituberculatus TaxID=210409 RepID=A0A5B7HVE2_PORTR|nr:hypothetical protein [Portunus trituberculatus]